MGYIIGVIAMLAFYFIIGRVVSKHLQKNHDEDVRRIGKVFSVAGLIVSVFSFVVVTMIVSLHQIPAGHIGIVYEFGSIKGQLGEGLKVVRPWRKVTKANIQVTSHKFERLACFSLETQEVFIDATLNIRVSPQAIQQLYREVGKNWFDVVVTPRVIQNFKDETVKYQSVGIAPKRESIRHDVSKRLTKECLPYSIEVVDLLLDNIDFSRGFKEAIESKQRATQNALEEEQRVLVEKHKAEQAVEKARGEGQAILVVADKQAEANKKLSESLTSTLVQYSLIQKLGDQIDVMILPAGQDFILDPNAIIRK